MADISTVLFGAKMTSPFILASGPRSYGAEGVQAAFEAGAGGVVTKTLRLEAAVNPTPHIIPAGKNLRNTLFNSEQWSDLTWEQWVQTEFPALKGHPGALIASLGHTPDEVAVMVEAVVASGVVDILECVSYASEDLGPMVREIRKHTDMPLLAKLTFNWGEYLMDASEAALEAGASGFTAIDSIGPTLAIDIESGHAMHGGTNGKAWMSGAAIKPVAVALVAQLAKRFGVPIVGTGGVINAADAIEMIMAGATAVGVCTAPILRGVEWFAKTNAGLSNWLDEHDFASTEAIRGFALPHLPRTDDIQGLNFTFEPTKCSLCDQCAVACSYDARKVIGEISRDAGIEMILDDEKCRSCGLCVEVCKLGALEFTDWPRTP